MTDQAGMLESLAARGLQALLEEADRQGYERGVKQIGFDAISFVVKGGSLFLRIGDQVADQTFAEWLANADADPISICILRDEIDAALGQLAAR